jgi:pyridinium-3,5-bisthiocarboxylic acid mononucleotide nickel chelatase
MSRTAYFDLVGGAAGDMMMAALIDAGAPADALRAGLAGLAVEPFQLVTTRRRAAGWLDACHVDVQVTPGHAAPHRHLDDVVAILERAQIPPRAFARARRAFEALADAEGRVHGVPAAQVHFHEVGALDAIVDVAGVCLALELLGVDRVEASPLPLGRGVTRAEHGKLPLPAPAVLKLVEARGAPVEGRDTTKELVTPTGAALLCALADRFGPYPALQVERVGYGAGTRQSGPDEVPNVTRVVLGRGAARSDASIQASIQAPGEVIVLEANLDNATPEHVGFLAERLLERGALDAFVVPVQMKKGRPGVIVTVLADPSRAGPLEDLLLRDGPTLGVRRRREARTTLPREVVTVTTDLGPVRVKLATRPDGRRTAAPEHDDVARLAREHDRPVAEVWGLALRAAEAGPLAELRERHHHAHLHEPHAHGHGHDHDHDHDHGHAHEHGDSHDHGHSHDHEHPH